jgi:probable HAF family extracellular repeat protein
MQDLGTLPGYDSTVAYSINDTGQVTGGAYDTLTHRQSGFVWDPVNGMRDINSLVPPGLGLHLFDVVNNNQGWLAAAGNDGNGHQSVVLLRP